MLALDARLFGYLGLTLTGLQGPGVSDPTLVDTATAMTINGLVFYAVASALERHGIEVGGSAGPDLEANHCSDNAGVGMAYFRDAAGAARGNRDHRRPA